MYTYNLKGLVKTALAMLVSTALMSVSSQALAVKEIAGKTIIAKGKVQATQTDTSEQRRLKRRSPIYGVDVITTEANSKTQLRMTDGGMIALKENSELLISSYEFNKADNSGSIVMELVKGGLRSMTGAIKSGKGNYQLKTPVGSIGIRGTHYEIEIINGELFIAVWDGAIDLTIGIGVQKQQVSLGEGEDFAYAKVDELGEVTELLTPPENFQEGHSSDPQADDPPPPPPEQTQQEQQEIAQIETPESSNNDMEQEQQQQQQQQEQQQEEQAQDEVVVVTETPEEESTDFIAEDNTETELALTPEEELAKLVAARTGVFTYNQPRDVAFSQGNGSNFQAQMAINFDTSTVETGSLSFDDDQGEWFASFNGIINQHNIEIDITFASHGNNLADGDISAIFTNDTNSILSSFELFELDTPLNRVIGKFTLD